MSGDSVAGEASASHTVAGATEADRVTGALSSSAQGGGLRSGTTLPDGYRVSELLGRGAMGEVYEARDRAGTSSL